MVVFLFSAAAFALAQPAENLESGDDGIPVILKHLPDWQNADRQATFISNTAELRKALGERPILSSVTFEGGTEAAAGTYDAGKLLIIEYPTPQFSIDADNRFKQFAAENPQNPPVYFRRTGNYEVFVFDATDEAAAKELLGQVKYQKQIQWLGRDPFLYEKTERAYVRMTSEVFISTILSIVLGLTVAVGTGVAVGMFVFYLRKQKRASTAAFSDAGGMVRLNLDELTPEISPDRLLKE